MKRAKLLALLLCTLCVKNISAQYSLSSSNLGEYEAIGKGEALINSYTGSEIAKSTAIYGEQMTVFYADSKMESWHKKYNAYLKAAEYGDAIASACTLFADGVRILQDFYDIYVASRVNPQGIGSSAFMNNLYLETACEFIDTYNTINDVLKKGGSDNMLTGAAKTNMLWNIAGRMEDLDRKLRRLAYSITVTSFSDVWNAAIAGMVDKTPGQCAQEALDRWKRALDNTSRFMIYREEHPFIGL